MTTAADKLTPKWLLSGDVRPYVMMASHNLIERPGTLHDFSWFKSLTPLTIDPLLTKSEAFGHAVVKLDEVAFGGDGLGMPRWVFYDCAVMPGLVAGFAMKASKIEPTLIEKLEVPSNLEWVPLSLFIAIPTLRKSHWMAHNLCSANEILPKEKRFSGLGFLSKAYGLWYANISHLYGVTQWGKPALKLHSNFGEIELVTAFSPIHSYSNSLTYRAEILPSRWARFFDEKPPDERFKQRFVATGVKLDPRSQSSMQDVQRRIEAGEGPFFLDGHEILSQDSAAPMTLYRARG